VKAPGGSHPLAPGARCELRVDDDVAHSFEDKPGPIDPAADADSKQRSVQFLRDLGCLPAVAQPGTW
jgi:hypothetical protein